MNEQGKNMYEEGWSSARKDGVYYFTTDDDGISPELKRQMDQKKKLQRYEIEEAYRQEATRTDSVKPGDTGTIALHALFNIGVRDDKGAVPDGALPEEVGYQPPPNEAAAERARRLEAGETGTVSGDEVYRGLLGKRQMVTYEDPGPSVEERFQLDEAQSRLDRLREKVASFRAKDGS